MPAAVIETNGLSFSYGSTSIEPTLEDVSLSIEEGSVAAIIGPNGCGKSTLLKVLLGILKPTRGTLRVLGGSPEQARRRVAYVPQRFSFDRSFPITVLEFLKLSHPSTPAEKIADYLKHLRVETTLHRKVGSLSGGQLQRVLIERAMLGNPSILYLDEPATGIDIAGERSFFQLVEHLHREHHCTVVMVSHELHVVANFADHVLCLNRKLLCQGKPETVLTPATISELFGKDAGLYRHGHHGGL